MHGRAERRIDLPAVEGVGAPAQSGHAVRPRRVGVVGVGGGVGGVGVGGRERGVLVPALERAEAAVEAAAEAAGRGPQPAVGTTQRPRGLPARGREWLLDGGQRRAFGLG